MIIDDNDWFLDKSRTIRISGNKLPHWFQNDKLQFVTFRLADSLPKKIIDETKIRRREIIQQLQQPDSNHTQLSKQLMLLQDRLDRILDQGIGNTLLRDKQVRELVEKCITTVFEDKAYIIAYVIMPNHVHMLFATLNDIDHRELISRLKGSSSYHINRALNRKGTVWQRESYDRIIRNETHMNKVINYIMKNPRNLPSTDYTLWLNQH